MNEPTNQRKNERMKDEWIDFKNGWMNVSGWVGDGVACGLMNERNGTNEKIKMNEWMPRWQKTALNENLAHRLSWSALL